MNDDDDDDAPDDDDRDDVRAAMRSHGDDAIARDGGARRWRWFKRPHGVRDDAVVVVDDHGRGARGTTATRRANAREG